jgi:hypothetical protein
LGGRGGKGVVGAMLGNVKQLPRVVCSTWNNRRKAQQNPNPPFYVLLIKDYWASGLEDIQQGRIIIGGG